MLLVVLWLAAADRPVDRVLAALEHAHYESGRPYRFERSDLFGLGPLVSYLRDHPHGDRPRTMFLGNSIVWGFGLEAADALPAQMQLIEPDRTGTSSKPA